MLDLKKEDLPDQALINQRILSQLDAIGKRLTAIESKSKYVPSVGPKVKNEKKSKGAAGSSLKHSSL